MLTAEITREQAIERLRESKENHAVERFRSGQRFGRTWAMRDAAYCDLTNLAKHCGACCDAGIDPVYPQREYPNVVSDEQWSSPGLELADKIMGEGIVPPDGGLTEVAADLFSIYVDDVDYLRGFVSGSMAFWDSVKAEIG